MFYLVDQEVRVQLLEIVQVLQVVQGRQVDLYFLNCSFIS